MRSKKRYEQLKARNRQTRRDVEQMRVAHGLLQDEIAALEREKAGLHPPFDRGEATHLAASVLVSPDTGLLDWSCREGLPSHVEKEMARRLADAILAEPGFVQYEIGPDYSTRIGGRMLRVVAHAWVYKLAWGGTLRLSVNQIEKGGI